MSVLAFANNCSVGRISRLIKLYSNYIMMEEKNIGSSSREIILESYLKVQELSSGEIKHPELDV
ncbi:MAG: hypothetical protein HOB17_00030 [Candidatus Marinimicrobia bacterium]|jgi:hypothetical protein|nr:hypothetical protein [Candidatus Neomarinimicrobiota bacterium]MBT3634829.1 hypothetical protein [Candidatus Neomarinimicrobiota bacterium]MBT3683557.1 hypothetical protein [Candidatus Neomarinimicrobiota bacterium]MBT3760482.1 hypothetical protein [Candidatus Neomarinimicrobiota bacterium]MBT3896628.1 hypothetical protein [Candidatus Neomarinimicrobiota bacterium]